MGDPTSDTIQLECPECGAQFRLRASRRKLPTRISCPKCPESFEIPTNSLAAWESLASKTDKAKVLKPKKRRVTQPAAEPRGQAEIGDEVEMDASSTLIGRPVVLPDNPFAEKTRAARGSDGLPPLKALPRDISPKRTIAEALADHDEEIFNNTTRAPWEKKAEKKSAKKTRPNLEKVTSGDASKPNLSDLLKKVRAKKGALPEPSPPRETSGSDLFDDLGDLDELVSAPLGEFDLGDEPSNTGELPKKTVSQLVEAISESSPRSHASEAFISDAPDSEAASKASDVPAFIRIPTADILDVIGRGNFRLRVEDVVYEPVDEDGLAKLIKAGVLLGAEKIAQAGGEWMPVNEHPVVKRLQKKMAREAHAFLAQVAHAGPPSEVWDDVIPEPVFETAPGSPSAELPPTPRNFGEEVLGQLPNAQEVSRLIERAGIGDPFEVEPSEHSDAGQDDEGLSETPEFPDLIQPDALELEHVDADEPTAEPPASPEKIQLPAPPPMPVHAFDEARIDFAPLHLSEPSEDIFTSVREQVAAPTAAPLDLGDGPPASDESLPTGAPAASNDASLVEDIPELDFPLLPDTALTALDDDLPEITAEAINELEPDPAPDPLEETITPQTSPAARPVPASTSAEAAADPLPTERATSRTPRLLGIACVIAIVFVGGAFASGAFDRNEDTALPGENTTPQPAPQDAVTLSAPNEIAVEEAPPRDIGAELEDAWRKSPSPASAQAYADHLLSAGQFRDALNVVSGSSLEPNPALNELTRKALEGLTAGPTQTLDPTSISNPRVEKIRKVDAVVMTHQGQASLFIPAVSGSPAPHRRAIAFSRLCVLLTCGVGDSNVRAARIERGAWNALGLKIPDLEWTTGEDGKDYLAGALSPAPQSGATFPIWASGTWREWLAPGASVEDPSNDALSLAKSLPSAQRSAFIENLGDARAASLAPQISTLLMLDFLTNDFSRFHRATGELDRQVTLRDGRLASTDNVDAFQTRASTRVRGRFQWTSRFDRALVERIRRLERPSTDALLFPNADRAESSALDVFWKQREALLSRIDSLEKKHGAESIYF